VTAAELRAWCEGYLLIAPVTLERAREALEELRPLVPAGVPFEVTIAPESGALIVAIGVGKARRCERINAFTGAGA
jgi:hypothetical protein